VAAFESGSELLQLKAVLAGKIIDVLDEQKTIELSHNSFRSASGATTHHPDHAKQHPRPCPKVQGGAIC
jgi:hypothetical protein